MNWRIFIRIRKGLSNNLRDIGEGPFKTKREAMMFGNAEVYGDWYVVKMNKRKAKK